LVVETTVPVEVRDLQRDNGSVRVLADEDEVNESE
jgi:hypothetical protein